MNERMNEWMMNEWSTLSSFFLTKKITCLISLLVFLKGDVRLADGGAPNQGRIEYYFNNTWWTLCSDSFHGDAHNTVCRQLGYNEATQHYRDSDFGAGNLSILHTSFNCDGGDSSLLNCRREQWYGECGGHTGVVGVVCDEMQFAGKNSIVIVSFRLTCSIDKNRYRLGKNLPVAHPPLIQEPV